MSNLINWLECAYKHANLMDLINMQKNDYKRHYTFQQTKQPSMHHSLLTIFLNNHAEAFSQDEIKHAYLVVKQKIDRTFMCDSPYNYSNTAHIILLLANELLIYDGSKFKVRFKDYQKWYHLINVFDVSVLKSAYCAMQQLSLSANNDPLTIISHNNSRLDAILHKGVAENHMHFKGSGFSVMMNFANWAKGMEEYTHNSNVLPFVTNDSTYDKDAEYHEQMKLQVIRSYLLCHAFNASLLANNSPTIDSEAISSYTFSASDIQCVLRSPSYTMLYPLYEKSQRIRNYYHTKMTNKRHIDMYDLLTIEETMQQLLFELLLHGSLGSLTLYVFNLYITAKVKFKFKLAQDNTYFGFKTFKDYENIKDNYILSHQDQRMLYKSVIKKYSQDTNVQKIEFRIAPKHKASYYKLCREIDQIYKSDHFKNLPVPNYGFVIHYIKEHYQNCTNDHYRHQSFREKQFKKMKAVLKIIESQVNLTDNDTAYKPILAIDAANDEIYCSPEHFGVLFRQHKALTKDKMDLKITYHAGEDFINLCSGLRAIDESIDFLAMQRGDRIGHGIALGFDINSYQNIKHHIMMTTTENHLDNIVWLYKMTRDDCEFCSRQESYLLNQYNHFIQKLYQPIITHAITRHNHNNHCDITSIPSIYDYENSMALRGDDPELWCDHLNTKDTYEAFTSKYTHRINHENPKHKAAYDNITSRKLYFHYHYSMDIRKRAEEKFELTLDVQYLDILKLAQKNLKLKLIKRGIVIESNPTSNRKISMGKNFEDILPTNFNCFRLKLDNSVNLPVCVNTDDSAIFQTNLANEYGLVAKTLIDQKIDEESVYAYIDYLRQLSLDVSFINE